jgi:hypothetical protein
MKLWMNCGQAAYGAFWKVELMKPKIETLKPEPNDANQQSASGPTDGHCQEA